MYFLKDHHEGGRSYLCVVSHADAKAANAKYRFLTRSSMLRPGISLNHVKMRTKFPQHLTKTLNPTTENEAPSYVLLSLIEEEEVNEAEFPMLGRKIIQDSVRWGTPLKIQGEFFYIPGYWEWTEDILARYSKTLQESKILDAVYASLYTYDRESNIMRAFCESWCPLTNTLHTMTGEWSISLWDLYKLGGLPVSGAIYDETIPSMGALDAREIDGSRFIPRACEHLLKVYCFLSGQPEFKNGVRPVQWISFWCKIQVVYKKSPAKRSRASHERPKNTHNPTGEISPKPFCWRDDELHIFSQFDVMTEEDRRTTCLAAFLSCWLCVFALPTDNERLIRPSTFEVASQMASGVEFSLAVPVLAKIYHGLNRMVNSSKVANSGSVFPAHYLYGWLAHYFGTHHKFDQRPNGPLMTTYSGFQAAKYFSETDAHKLIHEGSSLRPHCLMLTKNKKESLADNNMLDIPRVNYLLSLRTAYLPIRFDNTFAVEPYCPTRFSRQFGYCQEPRGLLPRGLNDGYVMFEGALEHFRMLLFEGSRVEMVLPSSPLNWKDLVTESFKTWWSKVTISDLRTGVKSLFLPEIKKKALPGHKEGEADTQIEGSGESPSSVALKKTPSSNKSGSSKKVEDLCSSDEGSEADFKHIRAGKKKKITTHSSSLSGGIFDDMPDFHDVPPELTLDGDFDLEKEMPHLMDESLSDVAPSDSTPSKDKEMKKLSHAAAVNIGKPAVHTGKVFVPSSSFVNQQSFDGSHSSGGIVEELKDQMGVSKLPATPAKAMDPHNPLETPIVLRTGVGGILQRAMRTATMELLATIKNADFVEVQKIAEDCRDVYDLIRSLKGNPARLQEKIESYAKCVKTFRSLEAEAVRSKDLEQQLSLAHEEFEKAKCTLDLLDKDHADVTTKKVSVEHEIADLEKRLRLAVEQHTQLTEETKRVETSQATARDRVKSRKERLTELEASPRMTLEDTAILEQQQRTMLSLQSSFDPDAWQELVV